MLVFFRLGRNNKKIFYISLIIAFFTSICYIVGFWAGTEVIIKHTFEPEKCSVYQKDDLTPWFFPPVNSDDFIGCNESMKTALSMKSMKSSREKDPYVAFSFPFSVDSSTKAEVGWIYSLKAFIVFNKKFKSDSDISFQAELLAKSDSSSHGKWEILAKTTETRKIHCTRSKIVNNYAYGCTALPIFTLGKITYDNYRFNVRFFGGVNMTYISEIKRFSDMNLVLQHNNAKFTEVVGHVKAIFLPLLLLVRFMFREDNYPMERKMEVILYHHTALLILRNVPFEYFWRWTGDIMYIHCITVVEYLFQGSLFIVWLYFLDFISHPYGGRIRIVSRTFAVRREDVDLILTKKRPDTTFLQFFPYWTVLLLTGGFIGFLEYHRILADYYPFFSPWRNSFLTFTELMFFDEICAHVPLFLGLFLMYKCFSKLKDNLWLTNMVLFQGACGKWFDFDIPNAIRFSFCIFCSVCLSLLQTSAEQLLKVQDKFQRRNYVVEYLLTPSFFTLYLGIINILNMVFLLKVPRLTAKREERMRLRIFETMAEMKDHVYYCCLHSLSRPTFCQIQRANNNLFGPNKKHCKTCCYGGHFIATGEILEKNSRIDRTMQVPLDVVCTKNDKNEAEKPMDAETLEIDLPDNSYIIATK